MARLADHLVGYLSLFLQLGVLALLAGLAALVRVSLRRRAADGWTLGLVANTAALSVLALAVVGRDTGFVPGLPAATLVYAALEDLGALCFVAAIRHARGARVWDARYAAFFVVAMIATGFAIVRGMAFFDVYRVHSAFLATLFALAAIECARTRCRGLGFPLLTVALALLALDYGHVPLLTALGAHFAPRYLGLESYVTMVLDIALGVGIVVRATDAAHIQLERRNDELAAAQRALHAAAYTDALCNIPNRAAFLERVADPPHDGVVAMVDLDGLKAINDKFGHAAGDNALATTARALHARCADRGTAYRIGGDEFAAIWAGITAAEADALLGAVDREIARAGADDGALVRISWGVAEFGPARPFHDAMGAADTQLYERRSARR